MNFTVIFCCYVLLPYFASFVSPPQQAITCNAVCNMLQRLTSKSTSRSSNTYYVSTGTEKEDATKFMEVTTEKFYPQIKVEPMVNKYFDQKLDHLHYNNANTWRQRYLVFDKYYEGYEIMLIWIGTDKEITAENMQNGLFNSFCRKLNALCIGIESRGYGESLPHGNTNDENLKYLNSEQALADVAWFIYNYRSVHTGHALPANVNWGAYGTFHQGTLAARMRIKYPHLVKGVVSISAPMIAKAAYNDFFLRNISDLNGTGFGYRNVDQKFNLALAIAYQSCKNLIENGHYRDFYEIFELCDEKLFEENGKKNINFMYFTFGRVVASVVPVLEYSLNDNTIPVKTKIYDIMLGRQGKYEKMQNAIQQFAELVMWVSNTKKSCLQMRYDIAVSKYKEVTGTPNRQSLHYPLPQTFGDRLSLYTRCNEHGQFETFDSLYGTRVDISFYEGFCIDVFPVQYYPRGQLHRGVRRTNVFYGGRYTEITQAFFIYGYKDPYLNLGFQYNGHGNGKIFGVSEVEKVRDHWSFHELDDIYAEAKANARLRYWTSFRK